MHVFIVIRNSDVRCENESICPSIYSIIKLTIYKTLTTQIYCYLYCHPKIQPRQLRG